jgi:hypothetical protein
LLQNEKRENWNDDNWVIDQIKWLPKRDDIIFRGVQLEYEDSWLAIGEDLNYFTKFGKL